MSSEITIDFKVTATDLNIICAALRYYEHNGTYPEVIRPVYDKACKARNQLRRVPPVKENYIYLRMIGGLPTKKALRQFISKKIKFSPTYGHTKAGPDTITVFADLSYCVALVDRLRAEGAKISSFEHSRPVRLNESQITFIPTH